MIVKNEISAEIASLSALVGSISRQTPYEAPEGYFSSLPAQILLRIGALEAKSLKYSVPTGYFDGFAKTVLDRIKAGDVSRSTTGVQEELHTLSPLLAQAGRITPYEAPQGYFEEISPVLSLLREKNPYSVPQGYFEELAPASLSFRAAGVAGLTASPAESESTRVPARVISMDSRRRMSLLKYAAAAVIAGLILTVGWLRFHTAKGPAGGQEPDIASTLSKISDQELQSFLVDHSSSNARPASTSTGSHGQDSDDSDLKALLGAVPDGDLKQYLEEHGGANDIATN
jgi:hypothetical protein